MKSPSLLAILTIAFIPELISAMSSPNKASNARPPWQLQRLDHVVVRCHNFNRMFDFYTNILGCTIDQPREEHIGRFGGALSHLRAGDSMIDLLSYDPNQLTQEGKDAVQKMHGGGVGLATAEEVAKLDFSAETTTLDHFCIRCEPFEEEAILSFLEEQGIHVIGRGQRKGADGVGPSIYISDPEGNIIELKGSPGQPSIEKGK
jgi:glyoxylase I family protein